MKWHTLTRCLGTKCSVGRYLKKHRRAMNEECITGQRWEGEAGYTSQSTKRTEDLSRMVSTQKFQIKQASRGTMNQHHSALRDISENKNFFPIFEKNSHFAQIWPNVRKNGHFCPKSQFLGKNSSNNFFLNCTKLGPKIVLYDRILNLPKKIRFQCQIRPN